jgi:Protein of unknown function (DUF3311)
MAQPAPPATALPDTAPPGRRPVARGVATVLLLVAIGGALAVPVYARSLPKLGDFPFFYWYQLLWVPAVAIACWLCYALLRTRPTPAAGPVNGRPGNGEGVQK